MHAPHFRRATAAAVSSPRAATAPRRLVLFAGLLCTLVASMPLRADTVRLGGTGSAIGTMQRLAEAYRAQDPAFRLHVVPNLGSSGGIKAVANGAVQIGVSSRTLKPQEVAAGLRAVEYGRTAFVLATTKSGVQGVSLRDIADLYSGRRAQWTDGTPVRIVLRPASDADTGLLRAFSPEVDAALSQAMAHDGMVSAMTDQDAVDAIERLPGSLGTASSALLLSERRRAVALAVDGVEPTLANVASGRYPYVKPMILLLRTDAPEAARRFVAFVLSEAGRKVLAENGHVPPGTGGAAPVIVDRGGH